MIRLILRMGLAGAALFAGTALAHAQSARPDGPPVAVEVLPVPNDQGRSLDVPDTPPPPVVPAPDDDSDED